MYYNEYLSVVIYLNIFLLSILNRNNIYKKYEQQYFESSAITCAISFIFIKYIIETILLLYNNKILPI